jgi:hypothetical protein
MRGVQRSRMVATGQGTAGQLASAAATGQPHRRRARVRVSPPGCRKPSGLLPARRWVTEDGPQPPDELGAVAATCERSLFSLAVPPACHKQWARAVSSGQSRSLRDGRCAGRWPMTWTVGTVRHCMACKSSAGWASSESSDSPEQTEASKNRGKLITAVARFPSC